MNFERYLEQIRSGHDLDSTEAEAFLSEIIENEELADTKIIDALTALTEKKPSTAEVFGFVMAMRARMNSIQAPRGAIDTCGTGGDKSGTFNISTAAALVVAAGGVPVAKHGNRAATSKCGSADVLDAMHIPIDLTPVAASQSLRQNNFAFLFAPLYHPTLKRLTIIRKQLGFPTVFNLLGPLLNPAGTKRQVIGSYSLENCELLAMVIKMLNFEHVLLVTSDDGLDEAGLEVPTHVIEIKGQSETRFDIRAQDLGLTPATTSALIGGDADENAQIILNALSPTSTKSPHGQAVILNAALALYVAGNATTIEEGITRAETIIESGHARNLISKLQVT